tara:strand:+ start:855 stop:2348 length:1494 start_codon:yes stop_codon:yes gene_type:complete
MATLPSQVRDSIVGMMMPVSNNLALIRKGNQLFSTFIGAQGAASTGLLSQNAGILASGVLSEAATEAPAGGIQDLYLSSSHEVAQFKAGDQVFLVGNSFAGSVGDVANTADGPLTVLGTSPSNQKVRVSGRRTAVTSDYAIGSSLLRAVNVTAAGGGVGGVFTSSAQGASHFDGPTYARALKSIVEDVVDRTGAQTTAVGRLTANSTTTAIEYTRAAIRTLGAPAYAAFVGGTLTFSQGDLVSAANNGYTATVLSVENGTGGSDIKLNLTDIRDATGAAQATLATAPETAGPTLSNNVAFTHNWTMFDAAIADLEQTGGDLTRLIAAAAQLNRRLRPGNVNDHFEMTLDQAYQVEPVQKGVRLRLIEPVTTNGSAIELVVEQDEAAGDIPAPLAGTLAVVDYRTGVDSNGPNTNGVLARRPATPGTYAAYTRAKGSNRLSVTLAGAVAYKPGVMVEFSSASTGVVTNQGWSPTIDPAQQMSWLLAQILDSVDNYTQL